jgi:hypothetical protein
VLDLLSYQPQLSTLDADNEKILWLAFGLVWGTGHLYVARRYWSEFFDSSNNSVDVTSGENIWEFGQCVTVVLLALPILSIGEKYYGT